MADWNEIRSNVERAASTTIKKTGELADAASLRVKLKISSSKLAKKYEELGRLTYKQLKTTKSQAEAIAPVVAEIDELRAEMKSIHDKIEADKAAKEKQKNEDFEEL